VSAQLTPEQVVLLARRLEGAGIPVNPSDLFEEIHRTSSPRYVLNLLAPEEPTEKTGAAKQAVEVVKGIAGNLQGNLVTPFLYHDGSKAIIRYGDPHDRVDLVTLVFPKDWREYAEFITECEECGAEGVPLRETQDTQRMLCGDCGFLCDDCGRWFDKDNAVETADGPRCEECADENYIRCDRCDELVPMDDTCNVSGRTWCERCVDRYAWFCSSCDEYFDENESSYYIENEDRTICRLCWESGSYFYCDGCGQNFSDDAYGGQRDGEAYCESCWEGDEDDVPRGSLRGYHSHSRRWNVFGKARRNIYFGVELEVVKDDLKTDFYPIAEELEDKYRYIDDREFLFTERDGSLKVNGEGPVRGFEVVFHPMAPEWIRDHFDYIERPLKFLAEHHMVSYNAPKLGVSTGMHVTMTFDPLRSWERLKFVELFYKNRDFMAALSRRFSKHLEHYASLQAPAKPVRMVMRKSGYEAKYVAVNLKRDEADRVDLAEVRLFRGTLYPKSFLMNLELVMAAVEFAEDVRYGLKDVAVKNFLAFLGKSRKLYPNLCAWLSEKGFLPKPKPRKVKS